MGSPLSSSRQRVFLRRVLACLLVAMLIAPPSARAAERDETLPANRVVLLQERLVLDSSPSPQTSALPPVTLVPPPARIAWAMQEPTGETSPPPAAVAPTPPSSPAPTDGDRSFIRRLHPILGMTALVSAVVNVFLGSRLKRDVDSNIEPDEGLGAAHGSVAALSMLTWGGSLAALLAEPPVGGSKVSKAHRYFGYVQIPLYIAMLTMGVLTRRNADSSEPRKAQGTAYAHETLVVTTIAVWGITAGTSF